MATVELQEESQATHDVVVTQAEWDLLIQAHPELYFVLTRTEPSMTIDGNRELVVPAEYKLAVQELRSQQLEA